MDENITQDADIQDVSLIDTPIAPPSDDTPTTTEDTPQDGTESTDKPSEESKTDADNTAADKQDATASDDSQASEDSTDGQPQPNKADIARDAYLQRQRNRQQIAEQLDQQYGAKTEEQLIEEGIDPSVAGLEALRQEVYYKEERARVSQLNSDLRAEAVEIQKDFPIFDSTSKEYDPDFTAMVERNYKQASRLQTIQVPGPDGSMQEIVSQADVPLYDYYNQMYSIYNRGTSRGAAQRQVSQQNMQARVEEPGGSSATSGPSPDSLEAMEARLGDAVIT